MNNTIIIPFNKFREFTNIGIVIYQGFKWAVDELVIENWFITGLHKARKLCDRLGRVSYEFYFDSSDDLFLFKMKYL